MFYEKKTLTINAKLSFLDILQGLNYVQDCIA